VLDPTAGGLTPTPGPKSLYFAVRDLEAHLNELARTGTFHRGEDAAPEDEPMQRTRIERPAVAGPHRAGPGRATRYLAERRSIRNQRDAKDRSRLCVQPPRYST
jgi:hypothetical protein